MSSPLLERFYDDIKSLKLRFPVAMIAKRTGYPKSNVSDYLNRKKTPSNKFMAKFYECYFPKYGITEEMMMYEPEVKYSTAQQIINSKDETISALKETIETLKSRIAELENQQTGYDNKSGKAGSRRHSA